MTASTSTRLARIEKALSKADAPRFVLAGSLEEAALAEARGLVPVLDPYRDTPGANAAGTMEHAR